MTQIRLAKSIKKYLRKEKARIRRKFLDMREQKDKIKDLLIKFYGERKKHNRPA